MIFIIIIILFAIYYVSEKHNRRCASIIGGINIEPEDVYIKDIGKLIHFSNIDVDGFKTIYMFGHVDKTSPSDNNPVRNMKDILQKSSDNKSDVSIISDYDIIKPEKNRIFIKKNTVSPSQLKKLTDEQKEYIDKSENKELLPDLKRILISDYGTIIIYKDIKKIELLANMLSELNHTFKEWSDKYPLDIISTVS
uniref:Uncharacterized protein n=1 Tax=viral metagenome TaxID=1070528 RepID=A0A6C0LJ52_9ZZZZ